MKLANIKLILKTNKHTNQKHERLNGILKEKKEKRKLRITCQSQNFFEYYSNIYI